MGSRRKSKDIEEDKWDESKKPMEGRWGWVVVLSSFMIHFFMWGIPNSFGLFFQQFVEEFKKSRSLTSWISSIMFATICLVGPIASSLSKRYGFRKTAILGSVCSAVGLATSALASSITFLIFTAGFLTGFGFGLMYVPAIGYVSSYFEEKRALAVGIAMSGTGIGTFAFGPLIHWMLEKMGWRMAILAIGISALSCCLFGAFFRPLAKTEEQQKDEKREHSHPKQSETYTTSPAAKHNLPSDFTNSTHVPVPFSEKDSSADKSSKISVDPRHLGFDSGTQPKNLELNDVSLSSFKEESFSSNISERYQASKFSTSDQIGSPCSVDVVINTCNNLEHSVQNSSGNSGCLRFSNVIKWLVETFDLDLLKNVQFLLFIISTCGMEFGYELPYVFTADRVAELKIANGDQISYLISILGVANVIGRLFFGYISDFKCINRLWLFTLTIVLCGLTTALCTWNVSYLSMAIYMATYGVALGAYTVLLPIVLLDILGKDKLTSSFGLILVFHGIACLAGPPVIGWIFDYSGSYEPGLILIGIIQMLSGVILVFIPCSARRLQKTQDAKEKEIPKVTPLSPLPDVPELGKVSGGDVSSLSEKETERYLN